MSQYLRNIPLLINAYQNVALRLNLCYSSIGLTANNIIDSYSNQIRLEPSNENYVREYMRKKKNYIKNEAPVGFPDLSKVKVDNFWK